jgi:tetratricopeptide (TPR) repeat protein
MTFPALARSAGALALLVLLASCAGTADRDAAVAPDASPPPPSPAAALEAMRAAREALAERPDDPEAKFALGLAWQQRAEGPPPERAFLDSARAVFEEILAADSGSVKALVHIGLVFEDQGKPDSALARYARATELAPQDPRPFVNLASLLYFHFKRTHDAKVALMRALELDPENMDARFNLGVLFADATLYREARTEWERVAAGADGPARTLARQNLEKIRPLLASQDSAAASIAAPRP